jgi:hypothetical protein
MAKLFEPDKTTAHWPIVEAYKNGKLSLSQAEAQLKDMGMVEWELRLYLDNDIDGDFDD